MKRTARHLALIAASILALSLPAESFDFINGNGNGTGNTVMLSHSLPSELLSVPTGGLSVTEWRIETGFNRLFDLKDLDQVYIAAAGRWRNGGIAAGFSQFGKTDLYAERTVKGMLMYNLDSIAVGLSGSFMSVSFGSAYPGLNAAAIGIGAAYRSKRYCVAMAGDDLNSPRLHEGAVAIKPTYSGFGEFRGPGPYSILGRITLQQGVQPRFGIGQMIKLRTAGQVYWGLSTSPLQFGGGIGLMTHGGRISYSARYHPVLGLSHTISVSVGSGYQPEEETHVFK